MAVILAPIHDDNFEGGVSLKQGCFVRCAAHTDLEVKYASQSKGALVLQLRHLIVEHNYPKLLEVGEPRVLGRWPSWARR